MKISVAVKLRRALIAASAIFAILVLVDKLGVGFRPLRWGAPASWHEVGQSLAGYLVLSILAGGLFSFFGKDPE